MKKLILFILISLFGLQGQINAQNGTVVTTKTWEPDNPFTYRPDVPTNLDALPYIPGFSNEIYAPYLKYGKSTNNSPIRQHVIFKISHIVLPNYKYHYIAIETDMTYTSPDEAYPNKQTKYTDKISISINSKTPNVMPKDAIPQNTNGEVNYSKGISIDVSGNIGVSSDGPEAGVGAGVGFSTSVNSSFKDFEMLMNIKKDDVFNFNGITWDNNMKNCYSDNLLHMGKYVKPYSILEAFGGVAKPANFAIATNKFKTVAIFRINADNKIPAEFEFKSVRRLIHAEGEPISKTIPSYVITTGTIVVDQSNTASVNISVPTFNYKFYTMSEYMVLQNKPLYTHNPPILPSGCYTLKSVASNEYVTTAASDISLYYANRPKADNWEKVNLVYKGANKYGLFMADGHFLSSKPDGGVTRASALDAWEEWEIIKIPNSRKYYIRSIRHNRYLSANMTLGKLLGTSENKKAWEEWEITPTKECIGANTPSVPSLAYPKTTAAVNVTKAKTTFTINGVPAVETPNTSWTEIPGGGRAIDIAVGPKTVFVVGTDQRIAAYGSAKWKPLNAKGKAIAIGDVTCYIIGIHNKIYQSNDGDNWAELPGGALATAIAANKKDLFIIGTDKKIYRHNGTGWTELVGHGRAIAIAASINGVYVVGTDKKVFRHNGTLWVELSGGGAGVKTIAASDDGVYIIGKFDKVHKHNGTGWVELPSKKTAKAIVVRKNVYIIGTDSKIYEQK